MKKLFVIIAVIAFATGLRAELPGVGLQPASYYDKQGENVSDKATNDQKPFFTGKYFDSDLGAYVFKYRNYSSEMGRWTAADQSGFPDGPNNYFYAPVPTVGVDSTGLAWSNYDFLYHFYFGGGSVILDQIGLLGAVKNSANNPPSGGAYRFGNQVQQTAQSYGQYNGSFHDDFNNSYSFSDVSYSIGSATLSGDYFGTLTTYPVGDNGGYSGYYDGNAYFNFYDNFTDPLSIIELLYGSSTSPSAPSWLKDATNLGGVPFTITGSWSQEFSGSVGNE
jgi:RHS repeat-associated protein